MLSCYLQIFFFKLTFSKKHFRNKTRVSNSLDPDQARLNVGPDLDPNYLQFNQKGQKSHQYFISTSKLRVKPLYADFATQQTARICWAVDQLDLSQCHHVQIQKVLLEGLQLWQFFLVDEGIQIPLKVFNCILLGCQWWPNFECWLGILRLFRGFWPVLLRNPIFLWFFRGVQIPCPSLWICAWPHTTQFRSIKP